MGVLNVSTSPVMAALVQDYNMTIIVDNV